MAHDTKLRNPIHSTSETLAVQLPVRRCHAEELGLFCLPMPTAHIAVSSTSHRFAEHTSQM